MAKNLDSLAKTASSSNVREWAARFRDDYTYPVDSILYQPDGKKLVNLPANELKGGRKTRVETYLEFLRSAETPRSAE